jgi:fluoroacetyl-CoA thioesterase
VEPEGSSESPDPPLSGASATVALVVSDADTALALRSGTVPVLSTPRVLALAEEAAVTALADRLPGHQTTVGAWVELWHLRPTRVGATVVAHAVLAAVEGKRLEFTFQVREGDTEVARGRHRRVVVDLAAFT